MGVPRVARVDHRTVLLVLETQRPHLPSTLTGAPWSPGEPTAKGLQARPPPGGLWVLVRFLEPRNSFVFNDVNEERVKWLL